MKLILSFLLAALFISLPSFAVSPYSPSEGYLERGHDPALNKYRQKYFYGGDGKLDPAKMQALIGFLEFQKSLLMDSAKMNRKTNLILSHGYENDRAEKEGLEAQSVEAETLAPLIFALEHTRALQANYSNMMPSQIHEKVETILLFLAVGYTPYPMTIFTGFIERAKNLAENFFEFPVDDSGRVQASNLFLSGRFASQSELNAYRRAGNDISTLNPPSSAIWRDNDVESYDPYDETYWNRKLFPPREDSLPVFHYERMGNGTIKFKTHWLDSTDLNKKGLPKKKNVTLRLGMESYTASVVNHFARIIGYPANPTAFRSAIKLNLGAISFEQFLADWRAMHGLELGTAMTHADRLPGENAVILKNVTLEAYPDKEEYRRMGPFRMGDNGLRNRREYRAMVLYNSFISLQDHFEHQSRVDAIKDDVRGWMPLFFIADTSSALGLPAMLGNRGTVNEFTWEFTRRSNEQVRLFWFSVFNSRTWKDTTYSDVKWLARRLARISTRQIDAIMDTSGFPGPAKLLYGEKFKSRINRMIVDFDLQKEGFKLHSVRSTSELAQIYPDYINQQGLLKEGAQEYPGNTLPILGNRFTPFQAAIVSTINMLQGKLLSSFNPSNYGEGDFVIDLGRTTTSGGLGFDASRSVSVNPELGPGQHRYLLNDKVSISIPLGIFNERIETPLALYYTYTFEYMHSVSTMREVGTNRFFALLNPFSIRDIRDTLGMGEQLRVTHSVGASAGKMKLKMNDDVQIEAALLGLDFTSVKSVYFAKPHPTLFEITTDHVDTAGIQSGIDIRTYLRLAAKIRGERSRKVYRIYRIDTLNETMEGQTRLQEAFESALVDNDFSTLSRLVRPHELKDSAKSRNLNFGFLVWNYSQDSGVNDLLVDGQRVLVAHKVDIFDRSLSRIWNDKVNIGVAEGAVNLIGGLYWGEGKRSEITMEGVVDEKVQRFSEMEVNISLSMFDNYCTRKEFEKNFKPFFNDRSGVRQYIRFEMPEELDGYPELEATMRWQLSKQALRDILTAASSRSNLSYLVPNGGDYGEGQSGIDVRDEIIFRAAKVLNAFDRPVLDGRKPYSLESQAKDLLYVLNGVIGPKALYISHLRKFTRDENIWLITDIENMIDLSHPTFRSEKSNTFWAPEVGKFQGHSFLDRFRQNNLVSPVLQ